MVTVPLQQLTVAYFKPSIILHVTHLVLCIGLCRLQLQEAHSVRAEELHQYSELKESLCECLTLWYGVEGVDLSYLVSLVSRWESVSLFDSVCAIRNVPSPKASHHVSMSATGNLASPLTL